MKDRREEKKRRDGEKLKIKEEKKDEDEAEITSLYSELINDYNYIFAPFLN